MYFQEKKVRDDDDKKVTREDIYSQPNQPDPEADDEHHLIGRWKNKPDLARLLRHHRDSTSQAEQAELESDDEDHLRGRWKDRRDKRPDSGKFGSSDKSLLARLLRRNRSR